MSMVPYVCPECGSTVMFYEGFRMVCKTRATHPAHAFTPVPAREEADGDDVDPIAHERMKLANYKSTDNLEYGCTDANATPQHCPSRVNGTCPASLWKSEPGTAQAPVRIIHEPKQD